MNKVKSVQIDKWCMCIKYVISSIDSHIQIIVQVKIKHIEYLHLFNLRNSNYSLQKIYY